LFVGAGGSLPLTFQWRKDGVEILGATNPSYLLVNAQTNDAGKYSVVVTNLYGSVTSSDANLSLARYDSISTVLLFSDDPSATIYQSALNGLGKSYALFTEDTSFSAAVRAAKVANTLVVVDSTQNNHDFSSVAGFVRTGGRAILEYWNLLPGSSLASAFHVTVVQPIFTPPPVYNWAEPALFAGVASPISLAAFYNVNGQMLQPTTGGQAVAGYTSSPTVNQAALVLANAGHSIVNGFLLEEAGTSGVPLARNEIQSLDPEPPLITIQPTDQVAALGKTAAFSISAAGSPPLVYRWLFNQTNTISGATTSTLTLNNVQPGSAGNYTVIVSNTYGMTTSSVATLIIVYPPAIVQQPANQVVVAGDNATFTVIVTNNATLPVSYQWRKSGVILTNIVLNSTTCSFTLFNVQTNVTTTNGPGSYRVALSNAATVSLIGSTLATLTVLPQAPIVGARSFLAGGQFQLQFSGFSGVSYTVLGSTNLLHWDTVGPAVQTAPGAFEYIDAGATNHPTYYYRLRSP